MGKLIDGLLYLELKKENFRKCKYNPDPRELPTLKELIRSTCKMDLGDKLGVRLVDYYVYFPSFPFVAHG